MNLDDFRKQIPQLNGLDDQSALDLLHKHYYPNVDKQRMADVLGVKAPPPPKPERSTARAVGDLATQFAGGAVSGVRMMTDLAGANNRVSGGLRSAEEALGALQSAAAQADQQEIARIMQEAEGKGWGEQIAMGLKAFGVAPGAIMAQALGTSLPTLATAAIPGVGPAAAATRLGMAGAIGGAQGAGNIKGVIYEEVKNKLATDPTLTPEQIEARAVDAQAYSGENTGQIALGGGLGVLAGSTGMERAVAGLRNGVTKAAPGMVARVGMGAAAEAAPEALQGGQEKFAGNTALVNEGFDVDPWAGVVAQGTMEAAAGGVMGGAFGVPAPRVAVNPSIEQPRPTPGDEIRATELVPEGGPMTRAANVATEAKAQSADAMGDSLTGTDPAALMGASTDPLANMIGDARNNDAASFGNIQQVANNRPPMPASDAARILEEAKARNLDFTAAPHPDGGFVVVPREWVTPAASAKAESEIAQTLERMRQADAAPVQRAPRTGTTAQELDLSSDPVTNYVDDLRQVNTPAAKLFVRDFDAGSLTTDDVRQRMGAERTKTPDERIAAAAAEGLRVNPKGDPFKTLMAAQREAKKNPGEVIEVQGGYAIRPQQEQANDPIETTAGPTDAGSSSEVPPAGDAAQGALNEQDAPSQPARAEAQAAPVEAPAPAGSNAAAADGVPAATGSGDVQADGVTPPAFKSLLGKKSTRVISDDGRGRVLYEVDIPASFRVKNFINGRLPDADGLQLKERASVTGNPSDAGYVLIDSRKQLASRRAADPSKNQPKIDTSAEPVQETAKSEQVKKLPFVSKEEGERLFGVDVKRRKAIERVDKGTAYFGTKEKAREFITGNGIKDTHEAVEAKPGRFEVRAKAGSNMQTADAAAPKETAIDRRNRLIAEREAPAPTPDPAPAPAPEPTRETTVNVPKDVGEAIEGQLRKQKSRIARLKREAEADGMSLDEKRQAQTKVLAAETTLRKMRTSIFDAEDAAIKALASGNPSDFAAHADVFSDAADVIQARAGTTSAPKPISVTRAGAGAVAIVIDPSALRNPAPATKPAAPTPAANTIFTEDAAAAARARLKAKLGRLNSGLDPEMMMDGITLAGYHIEKGARTFAAYARAMVADLGDGVKPYLKSWYMGISFDPRAAAFTGMDGAAAVEAADVDNMADEAETGAKDDGNATQQLDRTGERTLAGAPAEDVRTPESGRDVGPGADGSGRSDGAGDARADDAGSDAGGSLGADTGAVPVPDRGTRAGAKDAKKPRVSRKSRGDEGLGLFGGTGGLTPDTGANPAPNAPQIPAPQPIDFTITDELELGEGGQKTKFKNNVAAIRLVRDLEASGRMATPDEQAVLANGIRKAVADSIADESVQPVGTIGAYEVAVEGSTDKGGETVVEVTLSRDGQVVMSASTKGIDPGNAPDWVIKTSENMLSSAVQEADWLDGNLARARKDAIDLGKTEAAGEWPDQPKLDAAREAHKAVLALLKKKEGDDLPTANAKDALILSLSEFKEKFEGTRANFTGFAVVTPGGFPFKNQPKGTFDTREEAMAWVASQEADTEGDATLSVVDEAGQPGDTADYGQATQAHKDAAARFSAAFGGRLAGGPDTDLLDAVTPGSATKRGRALASVAAVAEHLFNREVVFVKFKGEPKFNGAVSKAAPGFIFLNIDSQKPLMAVLGHELLHEMAKSQPSMYANLSRRLDGLIKGETEYGKRLVDQYRKQGISLKGLDAREELEADIVGDNFMDPEFWNAMAKNQPGLFRRIVNFITQWLDTQVEKLAGYRPFGTDEFLTDMAAAREAVADAMRQFSGAEVGAVADPVGGDVKFSAAGMTEQQAIAAGFTMKAYRGVSKAKPFNDTGSTWLTTNREVAEAYAEEVMGYDDPTVITVMVKPDGLKRHDASRLTDEQRADLGADDFGNPQAVGIYDRSDDHPLGGSRRNVTVIHAPRDAVAVIDQGDAKFSAAKQDREDIQFSVAGVRQTLMDAVPQGVIERLSDMTTSQRGFNRWWHRTVGTQLHKAKTNKQFAPVYYAVQDFMKDVSRMATLAADQAPDLLPQVDSLGDVKKLLPQMGIAGNRQRKAELKVASEALFDGTLRYTRDEDGNAVLAKDDDAKGLIWTTAELKARGMSDASIKMYRQARKAINQSLDSLLAADVYRMITAAKPEALAETKPDYDALMDRVRKAAASDNPGAAVAEVTKALTEQRNRAKARIDSLKTGDNGRLDAAVASEMKRQSEEFNGIEKLIERVDDKVERIADLKASGYAPLMRFGQYTLDALDASGNRVFFGMYESQMAANQAARKFKSDGLTVRQGVQSQKEFELLKGVSPETAMLFAEMMGMEKNEAMQSWLQNAVAEQSALKRHIRRKGVEGFENDASRVVAAFLTSNSRAASRALHGMRIQERVENVRDGDVKDEAIALAEYVNNPKEEAQALRSLLFVNYIGGSVASALVNLTQTVVQTFPYLSQYGGPLKAGKRLGVAMKMALGKITDADLAAALKRAEDDGVIKPQEVFQLQAEASRTMGSDLRVRAGLAAWGSFFQLAEVFNRRVAFIAAYQTAKEQGIKDPFAFAENAVDETQGVFNKGNRPDWARGAVGATLFTFKTFTIQYVEFLKRLPPKEKALALGVLILLSGIRGLPFAGDAEDLIDTVAQQLGYNFTTKDQMDRFLVATLGSGFADFLQHGSSTIPGVPFDVSARLGMADLLPGTGLLKPSETRKEEQVLDVFGVAGGFVRDALKGEFRPIAIRNLAKGLDMYDREIYTDTRGRKVMDVGGVDALMKGIGLQPNKVAAESRAVSSQYEKRALFTKVKGDISEQMALGMFEQNQDKVKAARQKLDDWNEKNPEARIVINSQAIRRRVVEMRRDRADRFVRSAPKELKAATREAVE